MYSQVVEFARNDCMSTSLRDVPGLTCTDVATMTSNGIETPHQLIGRFLTFRNKHTTAETMRAAFMEMLADLGVAQRSLVTQAVVAKVSVWMPSMWDA